MSTAGSSPDELAIAGCPGRGRSHPSARPRQDRSGSTFRRARARPRASEAAAAIDAHLPRPFERTAVNGFGFVQIVRPRSRASLVELAERSRRGRGARPASARAVERQAPGGSSHIPQVDRHARSQKRLARRSSASDSAATVELACRARDTHVGWICRKPLKAKACPLCGKLEQPDLTRHSAAAAARIATCSSGSAKAIGLRVRRPSPDRVDSGEGDD